jgi:hypothetical protein
MIIAIDLKKIETIIYTAVQDVFNQYINSNNGVLARLF